VTWRPDTPRRALGRARAELLRDAARSNQLIAAAIGCSRDTVAAARRQLEAAGLIEPVPVSGRARRPYPMQLGSTFVAIELGARTTAEVAAAAGCSPQAAWKALKFRRRWPDDAAAARDRLDVRRSIPCEQCGAQFVPTARKGGKVPKFCSRRCAADSWNERKRVGPRAEPLPNLGQFPVGFAASIPAVVLGAGLCVTGDVPGHYWTSDSPKDRDLARAYCRVCPAKIACSEWALKVLPKWDNAIYAGLGAAERRRLRAAS
jgi:biotin operon repressor